ncbi:MAG TPA: YaeQ family protein [Steroidobacteraceae bacterium]|nr:YaeQ family protein [Steroidobacteraceae bacterium]
MALNATIYNFEINLSDLDRKVYQALAFRAAKHPSETDSYLMTRVLAYCLEYREGLSFSKGGLSDPDAPALAVHDLTGAMLRWIEVGVPEPARLHRASKASPQVAVYPHKDVEALLGRLRSEKIHRAETIEINAFDPQLIASISARLARRTTFDLVVTEQQLYLSFGEDTLTGGLLRHRIAAVG